MGNGKEFLRGSRGLNRRFYSFTLLQPSKHDSMKNLTKLLIIIIANCALLLFNCDAANRFWIAGSTGDWNNTANWSTSSGGSGGASVPGSSDLAKFDGNGTGNCTINATVNVAGIDIGSGYSGTISQGSYVVTVGSSHFNVAGGTFTGGSVKIDINGGNFTLSGGTFTSTADTLFIGGFICGTVTQFNHSGGTFSHNNGTVVFDGTGCWPTTQVVNVITGTLFYNLVVNSNGLPVNTATSDTVKADNNFAHLAGKLGGNCWSVKGNLSVGTNANGGLAKLILWGTNSQTYAYSSGRTACVELNKSSGTVSAANGTTSFAVQSFKIISGTFTAPTGDFFIGGSLCGTYTVFTQSGGTFTHNNGRVVIDPTGCWPSGYVMDVNTSTVFYNVKINTGGYNCNTASGDTVKADNNLEVTSGVLNSGCYSIKGNLVIENSSSGGAGQVIFTGSNNQTYSCATGRACAVTVNKTGGSVSAASGTTTFATQGFKLLAGSFTAPTGNFKIGGAYCGNMYFTHSGGTFAHNNGNLLFDPNGCWHSWLYVDVIPSTRFYNCTHNSNVSIVLTNGDSLHIENELALTTGYEIYNGLFAAEGKVSVGSGAGNITTPLLFCGSGDQDFSLTGGTDKFNGNIKINKPSGKVNLLSACVLDASGQSLTFVKGNIVTTATNLLALGDNVTVSGASNDSYVDGVVKKTGNDAFTFPVGKNGHYRKIGISAPAVTTDAYTAEYFEQNSNDTYSHSAKDGTLAELSRNEYWNLARTTGTSNVSVTLSIDSATSCAVDNLSNLKVAAWDGSTWKDKGNGGTSGNVYVGTVLSSAASSTFGAYGVGTSTSFVCMCDTVFADAGADTLISLGEIAYLGNEEQEGYTYEWSPVTGLNDTTLANPEATPLNTTEYVLLMTDPNGCKATDTVEVSIMPVAIDSSSFYSNNPNFYAICDRMERYFTAHPDTTDENAEDGLRAKFTRWKMFWEMRCSYGSEEDKGDLHKANEIYSSAIPDYEPTLCQNDENLNYAWEPIGPMQLARSSQGLISSVFATDENTIYVGTNRGGIFKTLNAMDTQPEWICITDANKFNGVGFRSIAVSQDNEHIVASTGPLAAGWLSNYSLGIVFSVDGGESFDFSEIENSQLYGASDKYSIKKIIMNPHPEHQNIVFALSNYVIYFSDDYGVNFEPVYFNNTTPYDFNSNTNHLFSDIEFHSDQENYPNRIWIAGFDELYYFDPANINNLNDNEFHISNNLRETIIETTTVGSTNITTILPENRIEMQICHSGGAINVLARETISNTTHHDYIFRSTDEGLNFTIIVNDEVNWFHNGCFDVSPDGDRIFVEGDCTDSGQNRCINKSIDGGVTFSSYGWRYWSNNNVNTHADIRDLFVLNYDNNEQTDGLHDIVFIGHDGGVTYSGEPLSGNTALNWINLNGVGLNNNDFFNISVNEDFKNDAYCSAQDNGHIIHPQGNWEVINDGDGYEYIRNIKPSLTINASQSGGSEFPSYNPYNPTTFDCSSQGDEFAPSYGTGPRMPIDDNSNIYTGFVDVYQFDFTSSGTASCERVSQFYDDFFDGQTDGQGGQALPHRIAGYNRVIHVNKYNPEYIYVAKNGQTWNADYTQNREEDENGNWIFPACLEGEDVGEHCACGYRKLYVCTTATTLPTTGEWFDIGQNIVEGDNPTTEAIETNYCTGLAGPVWSPISDITSDPSNPNRVWISFGGFATENPLNSDYYRVYFSDDKGSTWHNKSDGLPRFPVNRLVYQEGSNDLIYAATDIGVYYWDAVEETWHCYSNELPVCIVSDLEIDYCERKLYASTFGRGAWYVDLIEDNTQEKVISGTETWDTERRVYLQTVRIVDGGELTVTDKIKLSKDSRIIVEPGGKLIVDGGTLTNSCDEVWQGVEVWGDPNASQGTIDITTPSSSNTPQGLVIMKDALIENARIGVNLSKQGDCCGYNGGIIVAEDSKFRNCRKSVQFMSYDNNYNSLSKFTNTVFLCDQPMNGDDYNGEGTNGFVSIWNVRGIEFTDCDFVVDKDDSYDSDQIFYNFDDMHSGKGVAMIDGLATFIKSENGTGNRFINLTYGLQENRTVSSASPRRFVSNESTFDNCVKAVHIEGGINDEFSENTFNIPRTNVTNGLPNYAWGIFNWNSRYYTHSGNTFNYNNEGGTGSVPFNWGVVSRGTLWLTGQQQPFISGTGGLVHDNTFTELTVGDQTEQWNPFLKISCNSYTTNDYEWMINPGNADNPDGVLGEQGVSCFTNDIRAGNIFNDAGDHIWNSAQSFKYWGAGGINNNTIPSATSSITFVDIRDCVMQQSDNTSCSIGGGDIGDEKSLKTDLDAALLTLKNEYDTVFTYLDSNYTDTLVARIGRSSYSNATLTNDLLAHSLLSDEVLIAASNRIPFFSYNQFISIINTNSPVSWEVWKEVVDVYKESSSPPDTIIQAQFNDTIRTLTAISRDMNVVASELFATENNIIRLYAEADSMPALVEYLLDSLGSKEYKKYAVGTCLEFDTVQWARTILEDLDLEDANDSAFYDFYNVAVSLAEDTLTWFGMDSLQRATVVALTGTEYDVFVQAQGVLKLVDDSAYTREPEMIPEGSGKWDEDYQQPQQEQQDEETNNLKKVLVYPNPFNNSFTINYTLEQEAKEIRFEVYDLTGRHIMTKKSERSLNGIVKMDLGDCLGIYLLRIIADDRQVHKERLICIQK
jgi:hypothetical protein